VVVGDCAPWARRVVEIPATLVGRRGAHPHSVLATLWLLLPDVAHLSANVAVRLADFARRPSVIILGQLSEQVGGKKR
jgi:hypothetical protein